MIRLLDVGTGTEQKRLRCFDSADSGQEFYTNAIQKLIWSPDGRTIAAVYIEAEAYPSSRPIVIGKNVVRATRVIFGADSNPIHSTSRGAIAIVGIVCVMTRIGDSA